jgi:hypothetical protein
MILSPGGARGTRTLLPTVKKLPGDVIEKSASQDTAEFAVVVWYTLKSEFRRFTKDSRMDENVIIVLIMSAVIFSLSIRKVCGSIKRA